MMLIKLGGSAISDKSKPFSFNKNPIYELAKLLRRIGEIPVIVHGGGSFAHPVAKSYGLGGGVRDWGQLIGVSLTTVALNILNSKIALTFAEAGIPTYTIRTGSMFRRSRGEIITNQYLVDLVRGLIDVGVAPLLYGDVIPDDDGLFSIMSGDEIMYELALRVKPNLALFLIDLYGVYTDGPGKGSLIKEYRVGMRISSQESGIDVTGGLASKLRYAASIAELGVRVYVCSIMDLESVESVIRGLEPPRCTKILG